MFLCRQKLHMLFKYISEDVYLKCKESNLVFPFDTLEKQLVAKTCSKLAVILQGRVSTEASYGQSSPPGSA